MECQYIDQMKFRLVINSMSSCHRFPCKSKKVYSNNELVPQDMCMLVFHVIYPYYLTLTNGGWFSWVKPKDGVIVQCPNPKDTVVMKVFPGDSNKDVRVEVIQVRGDCSKRYKKGDTFILGPETFKFCPKALDAFIPYLILLEKGQHAPWVNKDGKPVLVCPYTSCGNAKFIVEKV